jgi:hypothetical protein
MITTDRLRTIALAISELPEGPEFRVEDVGPLLLEHCVTATEFMLLDDTPGRLGYNLGNGRGWHWKLRRWRNSGALRSHRFTTEQRCRTCGAYRSRNPETGRLRCPVEHGRTT